MLAMPSPLRPFLPTTVSLLLLAAPSGPLRATSIHPELVESHVTNPNMIHEISKFRSGAGHDFSYDASYVYDGEYFSATDASEPDSSMKHYFAPYDTYKGDQTTVPVYAPLDGVLTRVNDETRSDDATLTNKRIELTSSDDSSYTVVLFHVNLAETYPQILNDWPVEAWPSHQPDDPSYDTTNVSAGDLLGYADMRFAYDFDVAVLYAASSTEKYWVSLFDLMPDSLFDRYENRGATRAAMSISKAERLANPITWWDGRNDNDWVTLNQVPEGSSLGLLAAGLLMFDLSIGRLTFRS
jgi:hypothetical protein